ncbi:uncharacterized protein LOC128665981 [Bombina bombina]|uniref:uncharacterized protein LOC128665981 n=1 Tax=Bombina bombina TaxID=8345 RepID=UPI00235A69E3|nr:uncharacterized protein LOC128665981 [Bombina bombina]
MLNIFIIIFATSCLYNKLHYSITPSPSPPALFISPSLLNSSYFCTHELYLFLNTLSPPCTLSQKQSHYCKSVSHLMSLSLLLLLTAGDISPNPGPQRLPSHAHPCVPSHRLRKQNSANLIHIPLASKATTPFTCALCNSRSVCNKLTSIHELFSSCSLNLLALTETWLSPLDTASTAALSHGGLHFSHTPRSGNRQGGGVGILLSSRCTFQQIHPISSLTFPSFETHMIRLFSPLSVCVAVIYRPPGSSTQFLDHLAALLPYFLSSDTPALILGDFNIPLDNPTALSAKQLLQLTSSFGLSQWTDSPTHKDFDILPLTKTVTLLT